MKDITIDALTEKITISKSRVALGAATKKEIYFTGFAQIKPFQHREDIEGSIQASSTKYLIFIHNRALPLAHGDTITWITNNNIALFVEDYALCSKRDIYRTIRASTTRS